MGGRFAQSIPSVRAWAGTRRAAFAAITAVAGLVLLYARDWGLPGLYMDAINPEYLLAGILDPPAPLEYYQPGNRLAGGLPVFTGSIHHGSTQLYAALPFMAVFGADISTFRGVQLLVGITILGLALKATRPSATESARLLAVAGTGLLALEPAFVMSLRTQGYSSMFPLVLLLTSVLLLRDWRGARRPPLRLVTSGVLYGLAVFSYFIYAFFLPAMVWLVARGRDDSVRRSGLRGPLPWVAGVAIGYSPFLIGLLLIRHDVGGTSQLLDWIRSTRTGLDVGSDNTGPFARLETVITELRIVASGDWPSRMILGETHAGIQGTIKSLALLLLPVAALVVPGIARGRDGRAVLAPVVLVLSFLAGALAFGDRLGGHHYTALLPLCYIAFGCACVAVWQRPRLGRPVVVAVIGTVAITNISAQQTFHERLVATGGVGLYSNAIDLFARQLDHRDHGATVYAPGFGFSMPTAFLSSAPQVRDIVDTGQLRQQACEGRPQLVVLAGAGNEERLALISRLSGRRLRHVETWSQRDGRPVFQAARFDATTGCPAPAPDLDAPVAKRPTLRVTPMVIPQCDFLSPKTVATISWDARSSRSRQVAIHAQTPGAAEVLFTGGGAQGRARTASWAVPGTRFVLRDARTRRILAVRSIGTEPCPVFSRAIERPLSTP